MTNEELAVLIKNGSTELTEKLWNRVHKFIRQQAARYVGKGDSRNGCTIDDLIQSSYPAFIEAIAYYDPDNEKGGSFLKALSFFLSRAFATALCGNSVLNQALSLDSEIASGTTNEESDSTLLEIVEDENASSAFDVVENELIQERMRSILYPLLDSLPIPEQEVLYARYWLGMTCAETGKQYGISRQRIHQIEQRAFENIRCRPEAHYLIECGIFGK